VELNDCGLYKDTNLVFFSGGMEENSENLRIAGVWITIESRTS
jgi:hypothetical protein